MADVEIAGKKVSKLVLGGVIVGGGIAAYYVYKNHQSSQAAASASSASSSTGMVTDPATGTQYPADGTDPVTGETYAQEIGQYGSVGAADSAVSQNEQAALYNEGDLYGTGYSAEDYSTGTYGANTTVSGSVYTSNSAWAQAATAGLEDIGYTGTDVAEALGLYLTGAPVTTDEAAIIQAAIAEYGSPPDGSFQIITQPSGNTTGSNVQVPNVVGQTAGSAHNAIVAAGLVPTDANGSVKGEASWKVASTSPPGGTSVAKGSSVAINATAPSTTSTSSKVTVPNVVGLEADQAGPNLQSVGLKVSLTGPAFKTGGPQVRIITAQSPKAGSQADKGSTVTLTYKVQQNSLQPSGK